jgi:hypothetical protein
MRPPKLPIEFTQGFSLDADLAFEIGQSMMDGYAFAEPFQHAVIDDFLPEALAKQLLLHFPSDAKKFMTNYTIMDTEACLNVKSYLMIAIAFCRDAFAFFNSAPILTIFGGYNEYSRTNTRPLFYWWGLS